MSDINQAKAIRAIEHTKERLDKALSVLQEAVTHVRQSFSPVLKNIPGDPTDGKALKPCGGSCDYDTMVCRTEEGILSFAEELNQICQRSAV